LSNHLQEQFKLYGPQVLVNLLNQKGREKPVKDALENYLSHLPQEKLNYTHFDFHQECKHMRWDRIDILIEQLQTDLIQQGWAQCSEV
jgi:phosphatidylinositol 4-phosphatase